MSRGANTTKIHKNKIKSICDECTLEQKCLKPFLEYICVRAVLQVLRWVIPGSLASEGKCPLSKIVQESCAIAKRSARCALYMSASHASSPSRTRVKLNRVFPTPLLVSPKFPRVPLGIGGWPMGYEERMCWANCPCN